MHNTKLYNIIICGLLSLLPLVAEGQTAVSLPRYESPGWGKTFLHGGTIRTRRADNHRTGDYYLKLSPGFSPILGMDFVNGFRVGPSLMMGRVDRNYGRWELDALVQYTCSRRRWVGEGTLRYILPPQYDAWMELFGGRMTHDYDAHPLMDEEQQEVASDLFGWNGFKLYEAERYGMRGHAAISNHWSLDAGLWYEERREMENHRRNNIFGICPDSNIPQLRTRVDWSGDDPRHHWGRQSVWRLDAGVQYSPGSVIYVYDDLHYMVCSPRPVLRLDLQSSPDFLSLDLNVYQQVGKRQLRGHSFQYYGSVGGFPVKNRVELSDMRHFDASHFVWQNRMESSLRWFALLQNYELSTSDAWAELHGEYQYRHNELFAQYLQFHYVSVAQCRFHAELSYGWQLEKQIRIGVSIGCDGSSFDGLGMNLILVPEIK